MSEQPAESVNVPGRLPASALEEYMLLLQFGPAVLASVTALAVRLDDPEMRLLWESSLLDDLFGYETGELRNQPLDRLLRQQDIMLHHAHFAAYRTAATIRTMNRGVWVDGVKKDRSIIKVQVSLYPTTVGKLDVVIAHVVDVTRAYMHMTTIRPLGEGH